jgi:hypothetical protein
MVRIRVMAMGNVTYLLCSLLRFERPKRLEQRGREPRDILVIHIPPSVTGIFRRRS